MTLVGSLHWRAFDFDCDDLCVQLGQRKKGRWATNADIILPGLNDMIADRRNYHVFEMRMMLDYGPAFLNGDNPLLEYRNQIGELGMGVARTKSGLGEARFLRGFTWALLCHS